MELAGAQEQFSTYAVALAPRGDVLAIAGVSFPGRDLVFLDAASGKRVLDVPLLSRSGGGSRVDVLLWLDDERLVAGTAGGTIAIVARDGSFESWRGAQAGIRGIARDAENDRLVVCGSEKQLRAWSLGR